MGGVKGGGRPAQTGLDGVLVIEHFFRVNVDRNSPSPPEETLGKVTLRYSGGERWGNAYFRRSMPREEHSPAGTLR